MLTKKARLLLSFIAATPLVFAACTDNNIVNPALGVTHDRTLMLRFELKYLGDFKYTTSALDAVLGTNQPAK